jgi:uncharacterized membrane protein YjjP (DUF1212 family)
MIQRVQTLFLLAASALLFSMFFSKMAYSQLEAVYFSNIPVILIMVIVTFSITFVSIFLYRHRTLQIRLCIIDSVILLGLQGWILWMFFNRPEGTAFTIGSVFPVVSAILVFTAMRYIARDEALVRSTSRLRR